jgi:monoamine oxidase
VAEPDLIVVGAGAAGLAAARTAAAAGLDVVVLETKQRIGGRCVTDRLGPGRLPWERGANWIHGAEHNPFKGYADRHGFVTEVRNQPRRVWSDGWPAGLTEAVQAYYEQATEAIEGAGRAGRDVPAGDVVPPHPRFRAMFDSWFASLCGVEPERTSTLDVGRYREDRLHFRVEAGYGTLLAHFGRKVPVRLGTPARRIDWRGSGVTVETPGGGLRARAAIVTVSTNVLAAGGITFEPALPSGLTEAFEAVPVGEANKAALAFERDVFGIETCFAQYEHATPEATRFEIRPFGRPLAIAHYGGRFAAAIEAEGAEAMVDFTLEKLVTLFGGAVRRHLVASATTAWCGDPHVRGGYSCARPGFGRAREVFAEPLADRLLFAGEATSLDAYGTVHGARASGEAAADKVVRLLGCDLAAGAD